MPGKRVFIFSVGMSYVEVMIALMVLSAGILPMLVVFGSSQKQTIVAKNSLTAIYISRTLLDGVRFTPFHKIHPVTDETFKTVEGPMIDDSLKGPGVELAKVQWPDHYKKFQYNLKKLPVKDSVTGEILAFKLQLTLKWIEDKQREKNLHFATIVSRGER